MPQKWAQSVLIVVNKANPPLLQTDSGSPLLFSKVASTNIPVSVSQTLRRVLCDFQAPSS